MAKKATANKVEVAPQAVTPELQKLLQTHHGNTRIELII
jgi:hypothetical protein